ncbi:hypothetical protein BKA03_002169 [Demequina lutea]|uniref:Uncharacterized protein n=1 Tax=Demequina lutea TaxID=431489 RepID=A0A7Y9ZBZ0_9MICO|nr:hypothetical protein [Demequina lutea]
MSSPRNSGALAAPKNTEGDHLATPSLPDLREWATAEGRAAARSRLGEMGPRPRAREASRALSEVFADDEVAAPRHSERWERNTANQLVRQGFDPEYVAARFSVPLKQKAPAPERTRAAA